MAIQKYCVVLFVSSELMLSPKARAAVQSEFIGAIKDTAHALHKDGMWPIDAVHMSDWVEVPNDDPLWLGHIEPGWTMYYEIQTLPNRVETWQEVRMELSRRGMMQPECPVRMVV